MEWLPFRFNCKSFNLFKLLNIPEWIAACSFMLYCGFQWICQASQTIHSSSAKKGRSQPMKPSTQNITAQAVSDNLPDILLSGDDSHTALILHRALIDQGLRVQFADAYTGLESIWQQRRQSIVLLEVSGAQGVEAAVDIALQLKRCDPLLFVGYLADPILHSSGLAGDAIFPRASDQLVRALRNHFLSEA